MTRRMFLGAAACVGTVDHLMLEAIAAERMPLVMMVRGVAWAPFFELREYGSSTGGWEKYGIRAVLEEGGRFLFAFQSLEEREMAWRRLGADPDWAGAGMGLRGMAIFKTRTMSRQLQG